MKIYSSNLQIGLVSAKHSVIRWLLILVLGMSASVQIMMSGGTNMDRKAYDQMVKQRLFSPAADPKIVIVDIDEASLDQLKGEFGRWPWPRETLAAALDWLTQQGAQAVVFDILFADADTINPGSDAAFVASVTQSRNSYFPILRLNPDNDRLSEVRTHELSGFAIALDKNGSATGPSVAVTPPVFDAIVRSGRMGFHNIYPDPDGINRHYQLWEDKDGWRLWSLPARIAQDLHWPLPDEPKQLIQYTQGKTDYLQVPFAEVWRRSQSMQGHQPDPRFAGAIVIIGSTATSLFDVKVSPLDVIHPGVMILANAIDNLKNQHFLRKLSTTEQLLVAWVALLLVAWSSTKLRENQVKWAIPIAPGVLLGIGFLSLHTGLDFYLDLTSSASTALLFFTLWTAYLNWRTQYFSSSEFNFAEHAQTECVEGFAVLFFGESRVPMLQLQDAISQIPALARVVIQLGAVGTLPSHQPGWVYVRLTLKSEDSAHAQLKSMMAQLGPQPHSFYISSDRKKIFDYDKHWRTIWSDVAEAAQHMEYPK